MRDLTFSISVQHFDLHFFFTDADTVISLRVFTAVRVRSDFQGSNSINNS